MTRKRLGAIDRDSISSMRNVAEKSAADRRETAVSKAPPIGRMAGSAARSAEDEILRLRQERDELKGDAAAWETARAEGLVIVQIPLDQIDDHAISRDRRQLDRDGEPWSELKASLLARGQQTPIEVSAPQNGTYHLISGYRRLSALRALFAETGEERFGSVKALVINPATTVDAMLAMVEENEIRQDVSFYERGRICCLAADQGVCDTVDDAIQTLFAHSSRNRRYKIRNFTVIHTQIGAFLDYPEAIGERLGAKLAQALKEGRGDALIAVLSDRGEKFSDAAEELAVLEAFVSRKGAFADPKPKAKVQTIEARGAGQGALSAKAKARNGRVTIEFSGLAVDNDASLQALLDRLLRAAEED